MDSVWTNRIAAGAAEMHSSAIRDLLKVTAQPEMISFAGGLPAPELFPVEEIAAAAERALVESPLVTLQYGPTEGFGPLRELLMTWMARLGITVPADQVLVTSGSQQGLDMVGRLLIDPGALVAVEEPTYMGALQAWQTIRPHYLSVPLDDQGLDVDALEALLAAGARPRFLYVVSCFQNPTGVTLADERRRRLIEVASRYTLPIIEDDPYGELYYEGSRTTPLAALDIELHGELRHVVYLGTLSKLLSPGMRVGWIVAPQPLVDRLVMLKQGLDLHTGSMAQVVAYYACRDGLLEQHTPRLRDLYRERRDVMLQALDQTCAGVGGMHWTRPGGGMFLWVRLPTELEAEPLLQQAVAEHVAFVPGRAFHPDGGGGNTMRLNFSHSNPTQIEEGIRRLGGVILASLAL
ncbi:PLP-dependent aminotransferase family protein [Candidatus Chloroploca sp. Khr17]|uniref:aminotransferase-like domain-containing protein n=1 Tax=Candidatus Chloroploca sp. Khr17 TaxID=2496869 RepID=UPI00101C35C6|nr:PLP-dependent aminotransferase family protein [Candidatus Chloroploca sp. Khr17]